MSEEPISFPPLFYEIFGALPRQGPGGDQHTLRALALIPGRERLRDILDMGCGNGSPTLLLAASMTANFVALDNFPPFLEALDSRAANMGLADRIRAVVGDMAKPEFSPESFDLIWSEGAIACVGFEEGLKTWRALLRDKGCAAITDACWFTDNPPKEILDYLTGFYPGMPSVKECLQAIEHAGYRLLDHFRLPKESWVTEYYTPLEAEIARQRKAHADDPPSIQLLDGLQLEVDMYRKYSDHYGYEFFVAQKV
jgi:cyclopropane fatty-acyl-phospholipid synthase-like methyltransferase